MKKRIAVSAVIALMLAMAIGAVASAQSRVAVIDLALIIDESQAGQQGNEILQSAIAERQEQVNEMEAELLAMETALADAGLSDDARAELLFELEAAAAAYNETVARLEAEIEQVLQSLRSQIISDIGIVVQMIAEEHEFDLVIDAAQAYFYRSVIDLTPEVLQRYDELFEAARASD